MKILTFLIVFFLFLSCDKYDNKLSNPELIIKNGMDYNKVINELGKPNDSIHYKNADGQWIFRIRYENVENFSDYGFNIIFNDSLKVINFGYD